LAGGEALPYRNGEIDSLLDRAKVPVGDRVAPNLNAGLRVSLEEVRDPVPLELRVLDQGDDEVGGGGA
jgi:hypothetical protein